MTTCDICGKIAEEHVKRITFSYQFVIPLDIGRGRWIPEMMIDVCEGCGKKVLEMIDSLKQKKQEELHADR